MPRTVLREFAWRGDRHAAAPGLLSSVDLDEDDPEVDEDDEPFGTRLPAGVAAGSVPLVAMAAASATFGSLAFAHRSVGAVLPPQGAAGAGVAPVHLGPSATSARLACQSLTHPLRLVLTDLAAHLTTTFRLAHFAADPVIYQLIVHAEW
ncbi:hypothetical protein AMAG_06950 [Allomyces macrogynus ATCC 38327]|uniref:Uncharacterized protein n=1 Tax=Allomyces macrogynus (strain ATCC 38327) TaxID=578462 RepID=A0A0L0SFQ2_ALLM3|nr:hypothetical protein AMAG_06950 [Allomyces macrogynus ATCC 38327]|eukprot:KNE61200.1 hypothetical protein AMAG_06950 [Allomyces macrogynus ATCC 38327]